MKFLSGAVLPGSFAVIMFTLLATDPCESRLSTRSPGPGPQRIPHTYYIDHEDSHLMNRWNDADMDNILVQRGLSIFKSDKPLEMHCKSCPSGWEMPIKMFVQKKYNRDKNLNQHKWSHVEITVTNTRPGVDEVDISARFSTPDQGKVFGVTQHWILPQISDVNKLSEPSFFSKLKNKIIFAAHMRNAAKKSKKEKEKTRVD